MGKITIKALAGSVYAEGQDVDKSLLHGIDCQDEFVEYLDGNYRSKLGCGYMDFRYEDGNLWTYTVYSTKEKLTDEEIEDLKEYTQGQWSDGIGEGFEQFPCTYLNDVEVFVSPWYPGQVLEASQE